MLSFIDAYEISIWKFWSGDTNLGNIYTDIAFQAMESSKTRFLDLKSAMAKGLMGFHESGWEKYIFIFSKFQVKVIIFFNYECRQQITAVYAVPVTFGQ